MQDKNANAEPTMSYELVFFDYDTWVRSKPSRESQWRMLGDTLLECEQNYMYSGSFLRFAASDAAALYLEPDIYGFLQALVTDSTDHAFEQCYFFMCVVENVSVTRAEKAAVLYKELQSSGELPHVLLQTPSVFGVCAAPPNLLRLVGYGRELQPLANFMLSLARPASAYKGLLPVFVFRMSVATAQPISDITPMQLVFEHSDATNLVPLTTWAGSNPSFLQQATMVASVLLGTILFAATATIVDIASVVIVGVTPNHTAVVLPVHVNRHEGASLLFNGSVESLVQLKASITHKTLRKLIKSKEFLVDTRAALQNLIGIMDEENVEWPAQLQGMLLQFVRDFVQPLDNILWTHGSVKLVCPALRDNGDGDGDGDNDADTFIDLGIVGPAAAVEDIKYVEMLFGARTEVMGAAGATHHLNPHRIPWMQVVYAEDFDNYSQRTVRLPLRAAGTRVQTLTAWIASPQSSVPDMQTTVAANVLLGLLVMGHDRDNALDTDCVLLTHELDSGSLRTWLLPTAQAPAQYRYRYTSRAEVLELPSGLRDVPWFNYWAQPHSDGSQSTLQYLFCVAYSQMAERGLQWAPALVELATDMRRRVADVCGPTEGMLRSLYAWQHDQNKRRVKVAKGTKIVRGHLGRKAYVLNNALHRTAGPALRSGSRKGVVRTKFRAAPVDAFLPGAAAATKARETWEEESSARSGEARKKGIVLSCFPMGYLTQTGGQCYVATAINTLVGNPWFVDLLARRWPAEDLDLIGREVHPGGSVHDAVIGLVARLTVGPPMRPTEAAIVGQFLEAAFVASGRMDALELGFSNLRAQQWVCAELGLLVHDVRQRATAPVPLNIGSSHIARVTLQSCAMRVKRSWLLAVRAAGFLCTSAHIKNEDHAMSLVECENGEQGLLDSGKYPYFTPLRWIEEEGEKSTTYDALFAEVNQARDGFVIKEITLVLVFQGQYATVPKATVPFPALWPLPPKPPGARVLTPATVTSHHFIACMQALGMDIPPLPSTETQKTHLPSVFHKVLYCATQLGTTWATVDGENSTAAVAGTTAVDVHDRFMLQHAVPQQQQLVMVSNSAWATTPFGVMVPKVLAHLACVLVENNAGTHAAVYVQCKTSGKFCLVKDPTAPRHSSNGAVVRARCPLDFWTEDASRVMVFFQAAAASRQMRPIVAHTPWRPCPVEQFEVSYCMTSEVPAFNELLNYNWAQFCDGTKWRMAMCWYGPSVMSALAARPGKTLLKGILASADVLADETGIRVWVEDNVPVDRLRAPNTLAEGAQPDSGPGPFLLAVMVFDGPEATGPYSLLFYSPELEQVALSNRTGLAPVYLPWKDALQQGTLLSLLDVPDTACFWMLWSQQPDGGAGGDEGDGDDADTDTDPVVARRKSPKASSSLSPRRKARRPRSAWERRVLPLLPK
jgi:hypothetical protein